MVKFSCFHLCIHGKKPKRTTVQPSIETMAKTMEDGAQHRVFTNSSRPSSSNTLLSEAPNKNKNKISNLIECGLQSKDAKSQIVIECNEEVCDRGGCEKSQSLETGLQRDRRLYTYTSTESGIDSLFSLNDSKRDDELPVLSCIKDQEGNPTNHCKVNSSLESQVFFSFDDDDLLFSIGEDDDSTFSIQDPTSSVNDVHAIYGTPQSAELAGDYAVHTLTSSPVSVAEIIFFTLCRYFSTSQKCSFKHAYSKLNSSNDLHVLGRKQKEKCNDEPEYQFWGEHAKENYMNNSFYEDCDSHESYPFSSVPKDCMMPVVSDMNYVEILQEESHLVKPPKKYSQIQRTEDWVNSLQHYGPNLEGTSESSVNSDPFDGDVKTMSRMTSARMLSKVAPGMASAITYISSLSDNATAAQLADHGLTVIPLLYSFVSLKMVNLSGNDIVRITKGSLPRGLHILNLSNNKISNIEGLRELTRLCILDLSFNRILRIGQGLASCSSIKELYLAGNEISELEGLHRLLKLSVLDLRFNKISTIKCLDQLAANYNSLQAISLDGNPAQMYVRDEQLRKYLLGFLPCLNHYNKQVIKSSTVKASTGRSSCRLPIPISLDWRHRADRESKVRICHSLTSSKASASCSQAYRSQRIYSSRVGLKGRRGHLPSIGNRIKLKSPSF